MNFNDDDAITFLSIAADGVAARLAELNRIVDGLLAQVNGHPTRKKGQWSPEARAAAAERRASKAKKAPWTQTPEFREKMRQSALKLHRTRRKTGKPHWTQTPEGRAHMKQLAANRNAKK